MIVAAGRAGATGIGVPDIQNVIASREAARQSRATALAPVPHPWIASSLRSSQ
jgi:hypothetical protein